MAASGLGGLGRLRGLGAQATGQSRPPQPLSDTRTVRRDVSSPPILFGLCVSWCPTPFSLPRRGALRVPGVTARRIIPNANNRPPAAAGRSCVSLRSSRAALPGVTPSYCRDGPGPPAPVAPRASHASLRGRGVPAFLPQPPPFPGSEPLPAPARGRGTGEARVGVLVAEACAPSLRHPGFHGPGNPLSPARTAPRPALAGHTDGA